MRSLRALIPPPIRKTYRYLRARALSLGLKGQENYALSVEELHASACISVIVPIHDAPEVTERCLRSLERNGGNAEIILVDDGSKQQRTQEVIDSAMGRNGWALVRHASARGHSRACESGAEIAQRDLLCFLNSDTVITPFSWAGMVTTLRTDPRIAIVGPSTSCTSTRQTIRRAELCCLYWTDGQIDEFANRYTMQNSGSSPIDLDYVGGFAFIVTRPAWVESGGFDPHLSNYGNEADLCRRLNKRGHRILWTRSSYIHHFGSSSFLQRFTSEELHRQRVVASRYINAKLE
jgi:GT2 family glycosyltransferase